MMSLTCLSIAIASVIIFAFLWRIYQKTTNGTCACDSMLDGKTAIVTGGTAGMGLEIAKDFAKRGAKVIIACPFEKEGNDAKETIVQETRNSKVAFKLLDLASFDSITKFAEDVIANEGRLDILVNNAGGLFRCTTTDGLNGTMQVNYFGHFLLTLLLLPLLKKTDNCRIVNVSSILHWLGYIKLNQLNKLSKWCDLQHYNDSKLCVLYFSIILREKLKDVNIVVNCVDPGAVGTRIFDSMGTVVGGFVTWFYKTFYKTPIEGAQNAIYAVIDPKAAINRGSYIKDCKTNKTFRSSLNIDQMNTFWNESLKLCKMQECQIFT